jgi:hypothetical protein
MAWGWRKGFVNKSSSHCGYMVLGLSRDQIDGPFIVFDLAVGNFV